MRTPSYFLIKLSPRTVYEIQTNITKRGKQNAISRRYHAKNDKEAIATWRSDLNGIRRVINVRFVIPVWPSLITRFQTELWIDTRATGSDTPQDAADKHTIVSGVRRDASNTKLIVSDSQGGVANTRTASEIHRSKLKSREGADGQNQAVSTTRTPPPSKYLPPPRLTPGQRSRLQLSSPFNIASSAPGESLPPVPGNTRGTTSDVRRDIVSEVHRDLVNTKTMVSDLHHNMFKSQEGTSDQPQLVGIVRALPLTERTLTIA